MKRVKAVGIRQLRKTVAPLLGVVAVLGAGPALAEAEAPELGDVVVWGQAEKPPPGPASVLVPADLAGTTLATTEDLVKFEPGVVVRRRFIGDANGTLGMRGSNMFQTARSLVFADGVPLHYLLQSRWDGAPRWSLISASEVDYVEVLYGPFSAEYGGNAMGGVIRMESRIPQQREVHVDFQVYVQDFSAYGFDDTLYGHRQFLSYGDKRGDLSFYLSWNRLDNASQPQTFFAAAPAQGEATTASGALPASNEIGAPVLIVGDSGVIDSRTDNLKLKLGYELGDWFALLNLAHEKRRGDSGHPNSYLRDAQGESLWSGTLEQDGDTFSLPASRLGLGLAERDSLSAGLRVQGRLGDQIFLESNLSWFDILRDENRSSASHPADPAWTPAGQLTDFGGSGWRTADIKLAIAALGHASVSLDVGLRHEEYDLRIRVLGSEEWRSGGAVALHGGSGGSSSLDAAFAQLRWTPGLRWDLGLGLRAESWRSRDGHYLETESDAPVRRVNVPSRTASRLSPKFSLGYAPNDLWTLRYSAARAYRFPIVEELFSQYQAFNSVNSANPDLAPENGLHHNLALQRRLHKGELTLNLFQEKVRDVIDAQAMTLSGGLGVRTFLPVDLVRTRGAELVANLSDALVTDLNLRFNLTYTQAKILANHVDPELEGKRYPRMPSWRANLLLDYPLGESLSAGGGVRYASKSFGRLDNRDTLRGVYGAQDDYLFVNLKVDWRPRSGLRLGLGVENLFDRLAFVAHPWPGRTLFLDASLEF